VTQVMVVKETAVVMRPERRRMPKRRRTTEHYRRIGAISARRSRTAALLRQIEEAAVGGLTREQKQTVVDAALGIPVVTEAETEVPETDV
jgi:hypothetical protein